MMQRISIQILKTISITLLTFSLEIPLVTNAANVAVEVSDSKGKLLTDAVVFLENGNHAKILTTKAEIEQKNKRFNPLVTVVQTGTSVNFPNNDSVRHHVYSFSPAKKFELKLYSGVPAAPVLFDKSDTVVLGCNIHDSMLAFVYVVDTPYFAKTDSTGIAKLVDIPEGSYQLKVWHYALQKENVPLEQTVEIKQNNKISIKIEINDANLATK